MGPVGVNGHRAGKNTFPKKKKWFESIRCLASPLSFPRASVGAQLPATPERWRWWLVSIDLWGRARRAGSSLKRLPVGGQPVKPRRLSNHL